MRTNGRSLASLALAVLLAAGCGPDGEDPAAGRSLAGGGGPGAAGGGGARGRTDGSAPPPRSGAADGQGPSRLPQGGPPVDVSPEARAAAYERGLAFLRQAAVDGAWGVPASRGRPPRREASITALALTAFRSRPAGAAAEDGPLLASAADWLASLQGADGGIHEGSNPTYTTALAVEALAADGAPARAEVVAKAVSFLRRMQFGEDGGEGRVVQRADPRYGGFAAGPDGTEADLSHSQFAADALRAVGAGTEDPAFRRLVTFLDRCQNRRANETEGEPREWKEGDVTLLRSADGGAGFAPGVSKAGSVLRPDGRRELRSYGSMTFALLKCYALAGIPREDGRVRDALRWVRGRYSWRSNPGFDGPREGLQGLFYYYATGARALALLGPGAAGQAAPGRDRNWKEDLAGVLLRRQAADGSWSNAADTWMEPLPAVATGYALRALAETLR